MSGLKAIESATAVIGNVNLVYIKSDADRYIAYLKYKRCVAMSMQCGATYLRIDRTPYCKMTKDERRQYERCFWEGWKARWLSLANKFKETMK